MTFTRSDPRKFNRYETYKRFLRQDFEYCCAYCLRPEANFGGEACGEIDHFCPQSVDEKLITVYANLYWSCRECNSNKGEDWPDANQLAKGHCFVDPCKDDISNHYIFAENGKITAITSQAEYSIDSMLLWRDSLVVWRRETIEAFKEILRIEPLLKNPNLSQETYQAQAALLQELKKKIDPPVIDRAK